MAFRGRGRGRGGAAPGGAAGGERKSTDPNIQWLADTITCHAWNADKTKFAMCPNNTEVRIYAKSGNDWVIEHTLDEVRGCSL
jgi:hypothetical protein